ncbi:hypothetical protein Q9295_12795 [Xinfangfangia sp. CPCC 101601]|uniref:DUF2169 domain-containing protein n=1 Tax=Pseudogemmobacter lacusdianii TaxID=3069608 RepID=A0ABU0VZU1_9RHOB|nr:hypothetical protein [Xinfangfangia sp. CPCC 101601]MDQ2067247.1 hypothetical protein [Xinfangfangia sp. CPCC 101601]
MSITLAASGITLQFSAQGGVIHPLEVTDQGQIIAPLHAAPWAEKDVPTDAPPHQAWLRGDFLAAPMGAGPDGLHGLAANGPWQVLPTQSGQLRALLQGQIMGASVIKELSVSDDHPFLYQRHLFIGGSGSLPVANHAMVSVPQGAKLSFSRKRWFETLCAPLEPDPARGRSALAYPKRHEDPTEFPGKDGPVNLHSYPWGAAHEDFVAAVEEPSSALGWTAVVRPAEGDLFLSLKNPMALPMTMLWHSNGGRDYAPWNGRHHGCLGVEEGAALPNLGLSSQETPDPLAAAGQPGLLQLEPAGTVDLRHVIGAIHWPSGQAVAAVRLEGDELTVTGDWGAERRLPFRGAWLRLNPAQTTAKPARDWDF